MVKFEPAADLLECSRVQLNASSRLLTAGRGEVREDVGEARGSGHRQPSESRRRIHRPIPIPWLCLRREFTRCDHYIGPRLSLALISLICAISMV
jgi:hypothetical protein